jgi:hypothetical protein
MSTVGEERVERERRDKRKGGRNGDFNALLIHFNSCFKLGVTKTF